LDRNTGTNVLEMDRGAREEHPGRPVSVYDALLAALVLAGQFASRTA